MNTWFTADTHFNHANIIKFCNRPFDSVEEMNETLIEHWNEVVKHSDIVYHLGDFGFGKVESILLRLNGRKRLIPGGHDKFSANVQLMESVEILPQLYEYKFPKFHDPRIIVLCHYAMRVWEESHFNSWHLYGHSHGMLVPHMILNYMNKNMISWGKSFDCGVDTHNFYPYSLDQVEEVMRIQPDNFNYIGEGR